jgi:DDE_Tnp_1-associated
LPCQDAISAAPAGTATAGDDGADLHGYRNLLKYLQGVPEPRRKCGIRHRLPVVLAFAVAAVLAGADSVTGISEWASDAPPEVLEALGAWRHRRRGRRVAPSRKTFRRVLARLEAQAVAAAFGAWLKAQVTAGLADAATLIIALDGKTVRGARAGEEKAPHLLAAMICGARSVLAQKDGLRHGPQIGAARAQSDDFPAGARSFVRQVII